MIDVITTTEGCNPCNPGVHATKDFSKPYIFVSYCHGDTEAVCRLLQVMEENHFRFWYDEGIASGSQWEDVLYERITDCAQFVCFFTQKAVQSEHIKNEVHLARKYGKQILPVFLDDVTLRGGLELALDRHQSLKAADYTTEEFHRQLCRSLDRNTLEKIDAPTNDIFAQLQSRYRILSQIGGGFGGNVYLAENLRTGGKVVIKSAALDDSYTGDSIRCAFRNECSALSAQVSCHAPVVLDFLSDEHNIFLVETLVQGTPLDKLTGLTDMEILGIFRKTARLLQRFHDAGLVHCDMKPEHIFIDGDEVSLVDFGACHRIGQCCDNYTIGTLHYAAPEQFRASAGGECACEIDGRTDIFALGRCLLFVLAANHGLLEIKDFSKTALLDRETTFYEKDNSYVVDRDGYCDAIHPLLRAVVDKMTARDMEKRFRSMEEVNRCLAAFCESI